MYWWNVSKLAEDFREGRVEEKERFKYFLATTGVWAVMAMPVWFGPKSTPADTIFAAVHVAITIAGTILCYRANSSGDNTDFIGRIICLSWPILIKMGVLFLPIFLSFSILSVILFVAFLGSGFVSESDVVVKILGTIIIDVFVIYYYWLIYKYITLVAHPKISAAPRLTSPVESLEV